MKKRPIVGITAKHGSSGWSEEHTFRYVDVLRRYDVEPIVLSPDVAALLPNGDRFTPDDMGRLPAEVIDALDGLVLAGGGDVDPTYFGATLDGANEAGIDLKRDELELGLSRVALAADLPILGICRGCQVLNVAAGGGMIQHFEGHRSSTEDPLYHDIVIQPGSRFLDVVGSERLSVNTYHHQGMDRASMAPGFAAVGMAAPPDDWLVEAFESRSHHWVFGVQWHPERLHELGDGHRRVWDSFVASLRV